jgi:hypothetical protein
LKALTIWQPWASLIMVGAKPYEFRPKSFQVYVGPPRIGDRIVIHAGSRPVKRAEVEDLLQRLNDDEETATTGLKPEIARQVLFRCREAAKYQALPLGCGLGTAIIGRPLNAGRLFRGPVADSDRAAEDLDAYNWAWPLTGIKPFEEPIPMRGSQGFWNWPEAAWPPTYRNLPLS